MYNGGMSKAARAIIIQDNKILVMHRNKYGSEYFTLVGGRVAEGENTEQALVREIREETGLTVTAASLVFIEEHAAPYNEQYVYLCEVAPNSGAAIQEDSEEAQLNRFEVNVHELRWIEVKAFASIPFRTPQLHEAIVRAFKKGFPHQAIKL